MNPAPPSVTHRPGLALPSQALLGHGPRDPLPDHYWTKPQGSGDGWCGTSQTQSANVLTQAPQTRGTPHPTPDQAMQVSATGLPSLNDEKEHASMSFTNPTSKLGQSVLNQQAMLPTSTSRAGVEWNTLGQTPAGAFPMLSYKRAAGIPRA